MSSRASRVQRAKHTRSPLFIVLFVLIAFFGIGTAFAVGLVHQCDRWLEDLPDYSNPNAFSAAGPTKVYAADGTTLLAEFYLENRIPVSYEQVSPYVMSATVCTEDVRFYEHSGIDFQGIGRAVIVNLTSGGATEGASTITQQFVRNTILLDEMSDITLKRKVREAYIALEVERQYSKDEILMMYLNTINYGDGAYGIESAAQNYFMKSAKDLTLSESALLAGIPQAPSRLNPVNNYEASIERRNTVLKRMLTNGAITQAEYDQALAETITLNLKPEAPEEGIYAYPYFTSYVRAQLLNKYSTAEVFKGGLTVYTTLNVAMQNAAEEACNNKLAGMEDDIEVSLTSIDPSNGHVVAMVGGKDYYTDKFNLATQARRQCGSSFKTFTLVTAIEHGISPSTMVSCSSPVNIGSWRVENYGGASYGTMSIASATAISSNTAYARMIEKVGAEAVVDTAKRMGITSDLEAVNSITLGSQGVCTMEMADAYATLAASGVHHPATVITRILDRNGNTFFEYDPVTSATQALTGEVAYAATQVLQGVVNSGTAVGASLGWQVSAGKTGTTQNYRDSYYAGYTPQLATAVWIGSREERPIADNMGGSNCCPVWRNFMNAALEGMEAMSFTKFNNPSYTDNTPIGSDATSVPTAELEAQKKAEEEAAAKAAADAAKKEQDATKPTPTEPTDPTKPTDPTEPTKPDDSSHAAS